MMSFAGWKNYSVTGRQWIEEDREPEEREVMSSHMLSSLASVFYSKTCQMIYTLAQMYEQL